MSKKLNNEVEHVIQLYDSGQSIGEIAEQFGSYPNKIRRMLLKAGKALRSHSEAQAKAIAAGRHKHPTKGVKRSEAVKKKISEGVYTVWKNLSEDELRQRSQTAKEQWAKMSLGERQKIQQAAIKAIRKSAAEGSKLEKFLHEVLTEANYVVEFHKENLLANIKLHVDIFLPTLSVAIEIDGPSHFLPIWGEDNLQRNMKSDLEKTGLLLSNNIVLIRIRHRQKNVSQKLKRTIKEKLLSKLDDISRQFPDRDNRYIELEV